MSYISVILVEPENSGNVGAVARVMKNFGFSDLIIIKPKCSIRSLECISRAKHAGDILKKARALKKLPKLDCIIATTSQLGSDYNIPRSPLTPEQLSKTLSKLNSKNKKIGILFGREGTGLTNEEILSSDFTLTIPSDKRYPVLNLSHSVAVILYELSKTQKNKIGDNITPIGKPEKDQIQKMFNKLFNRLDFNTKEKKDTQKRVWKRIIAKSFLTKRESYAIMGLLRKLIK